MAQILKPVLMVAPENVCVVPGPFAALIDMVALTVFISPEI